MINEKFTFLYSLNLFIGTLLLEYLCLDLDLEKEFIVRNLLWFLILGFILKPPPVVYSSGFYNFIGRLQLLVQMYLET